MTKLTLPLPTSTTSEEAAKLSRFDPVTSTVPAVTADPAVTAVRTVPAVPPVSALVVVLALAVLAGVMGGSVEGEAELPRVVEARLAGMVEVAEVAVDLAVPGSGSVTGPLPAVVEVPGVELGVAEVRLTGPAVFAVPFGEVPLKGVVRPGLIVDDLVSEERGDAEAVVLPGSVAAVAGVRVVPDGLPPEVMLDFVGAAVVETNETVTDVELAVHCYNHAALGRPCVCARVELTEHWAM